MENLGFHDSDHSVYERNLGVCCSAAMPRPRHPHHLSTFQHLHSHATVITHANSPAIHGLPVTTHSNTISHAHLVGSHGIPATAHLHGGRVVGVTGVPNATHSTPVGAPQVHSTSFPGPASQPLYSCQTSRGHEHVYQCPGYRPDHIDHHHHHTTTENRDHQLDVLETQHHQVDHYCDNHVESNMFLNHKEKDRQTSAGPDQRTEYHYGGSDYSSTEPIYAQPHLHPQDGSQPSPARTPPPPPLSYTTVRGSLRTSSSSVQHHGGTPARFLVRTDSTGASTSSALPTVSALMAMDPAQSRSRTTINNQVGKITAISNSKLSSGKVKNNGMLGAWRVKYLEGTGRNKRTGILLGLLILLLVLVLGGLGAVLYLTLGGGLGAIVEHTPQLVHLTEKGSNMVAGQFRITNQNFWHGLKDSSSESYKLLSKSIEREMDQLFLNSVWAREFNRSEVVSLLDGSLVVRSRLYLNTPDASAAKKLGSAFLRGLHKRHNQEWLGPYTVDITSIRFAEVLVDDSSVPNTTFRSPFFHLPSSTTSNNTRFITRDDRTSKSANVGWGEWGPWSSCIPCSSRYDQIRTRKCRLDNGKGLLVSNNDLCLPEGLYLLQGEKGNTETRRCRCDLKEEILEKDDSFFNVYEDVIETTTDVSFARTSTKLREKTTYEGKFSTEDKEGIAEEQKEEIFKSAICADACDPGQVCIALAEQSFPTCQKEKNENDPTGCGGLCIKDIEVCQALGPRAFQCHSASQCLDDEWRCVDGLCIPQAKRCDGHLNCYDRSDENMCKCSSDEFHCGNQTSCLPLSAKCDGSVDCWDGLDEANCSNVGNNGDSATDLLTVGVAVIKPLAVPSSGDSFNSDHRTGDASIHPPSLTSINRVGISAMNRTAIGLSSLSNRERELLS